MIIKDEQQEHTPIEEGRPNLTYALIKANLSKPIPTEIVSKKPVYDKNQNQIGTIDYVNVTDLKDLMDVRAGIWTVDDVRYYQFGEQIICVLKLTIHTSEGSFSQIGNGFEEINVKFYGDSASNSYAQAFRRACENHGLGRELWRGKEEHQHFNEFDQRQEEQFPANPIAKSLSDLVTAKQLGMIRALAREIGINPDDECDVLMKCKTDELSKRAASGLIQHLNDLRKQKGVGENLPPQRQIETKVEETKQTEGNSNIGPHATEKQKEYAKNIAEEKKLNVELISLERYKIEFDNLSKENASNLIKYLSEQKPAK